MLANRKTAGTAMSRRWGFMVLGIILSVLFGSKAEADIRKGIAAYQRGEYERALQEFEKAARKGDAQAYCNLGIFYREGKAMPPDLKRSFEMYKRGAEKGSVLSALNLGQAYRKGEGVAVDYAEAARWYEFAARRGDYRQATNSASSMWKAKVCEPTKSKASPGCIRARIWTSWTTRRLRTRCSLLAP